LGSQRGSGAKLVGQPYPEVDVVGGEQAPPIHTFGDEQLVHCPPLTPQAEVATPAAHVPEEQQPPWHGWLAEHDVVH
jgi:hypothetical protein